MMVVRTAVVRMGEGERGREWTRLTGHHAIDCVGRTAAVSATDCGVRAEMVVSTAVVRMGEGARGRERERVDQAHRAPCDTRRRMHRRRLSD